MHVSFFSLSVVPFFVKLPLMYRGMETCDGDDEDERKKLELRRGKQREEKKKSGKKSSRVRFFRVK